MPRKPERDAAIVKSKRQILFTKLSCGGSLSNMNRPDSSIDATITTIARLSALVESHFKDNKSTTVIYRGHGAVSFKLVPKVGRLQPNANSGRKTVNEELMLELFRRQSVDRIPVPAANDWELLAIAQHHGMATRLLDWTRSPLVALYFAVCIECESRHGDGHPKREDAEIIAWRCPKEDLTKQLPGSGPLKIERPIRYIPRIVTPRLRAQSGLFTAHQVPTDELHPDPGTVTRMRIPHDERQPLKVSLFRHGIHENVLFPDLDGLARHIQWCQTKCH